MINLLPLEDKKELSKFLLESLLAKETKIQTAEEVDIFLKYISVFVISNPSQDADRYALFKFYFFVNQPRKFAPDKNLERFNFFDTSHEG